MPSATLCAVSTENPRISMARARRLRKGWSSSTISNVFSACAVVGAVSGEATVCCIVFYRLRRSWTIGNVPSVRCGNKGLDIRGLACAGLGTTLQHLEYMARPDDRQHRAALRHIGGGKRRAGTLEQRLGDEQPEAEPRPRLELLRVPAARRHIRLADAREDVGGKSLPV